MSKFFKRFLTVVLVICMAMTMVVTASATEAGDNHSAALSVSASKSGEQVVVTVSANFTNIRGIQFKLNYDSSKLDYVSKSNSGLVSGTSVSKKNGYLNVIVGPTDEPASGKGELISFTFDVKSDVVATFSLSDGKYTDPNKKTQVASLGDPVTITVREPSYSITKTQPEHGKVSVNKTTAKAGETVKVTVTPDTGYGVDKVTVNGKAVSVSNNSCSFTMPAENVEVSVTFKKTPYKVTVDKNVSNGTVTVDKSTATVGDTVTITVKPNAEYLVKSVTASDASVTKKNDTTYTFTMPAKDVTVSAAFTVKTYKVEAADLENGKVSVNKTTAKAGETVTVTVTPNKGYAVKSVTAGSAVVSGSGNSWSFTMPKKDVTISVTFKKASVDCDGGVNCVSRKFKDVNTKAWYHPYVDFVVERNLMRGMEEDKFGPNVNLSRAMLVTILYRYENEPAVTGKMPFTDVPSKQYYYNAVLWAAENDIVNGVAKTTFAPNANITREQMVAILYRYAKYKGVDVSAQANISGFTDSSKVSGYAKAPFAWTVSTGIIVGDNGKLMPKANATRAEVAAVLQRYIVNIIEN